MWEAIKRLRCVKICHSQVNRELYIKKREITNNEGKSLQIVYIQKIIDRWIGEKRKIESGRNVACVKIVFYINHYFCNIAINS